MLVRSRSQGRRGAVAVENAFILPVFITMILGTLTLSLGVFRYQEMSYLAREGARWASVHGGQYAIDTGNTAATSDDVYNNAIKPKMATLDPSSLTHSVTWSTNNFPYHTTTDANSNLVKVTNTVTVTVSYNWIPEAFFGGITLTSTSVMPMCY
jgi:Flp pilus assembly protein TadG